MLSPPRLMVGRPESVDPAFGQSLESQETGFASKSQKSFFENIISNPPSENSGARKQIFVGLRRKCEKYG